MAAIGSKLYVAFGLAGNLESSQASNDLWAIDVSTVAATNSSTWVRTIVDGADNAPAQRHSLAMVAYRGTLMAIGGQHLIAGALDHVWQVDVCSPRSCPQGQSMPCAMNATDRGVCTECPEGRFCCHEAPYNLGADGAEDGSSSASGVCGNVVDRIMIRGCARSRKELSDKISRSRLDEVFRSTTCNQTVADMCQSVGGFGAKDQPLLCSKVIVAMWPLVFP
jgi:hypothetical protein